MDEEEEFNILECSLKDLGLYEKGMNLEDMRTIQGVLDESVRESSVIYEEQLQAAILESEQTACDSFQRNCEASTSFEESDNSNSWYSSFTERSYAPLNNSDCSHFQVKAEIHDEPRMETYLLDKEIAIETKNMKTKMQTGKAYDKKMLGKKDIKNEKSSSDVYGVLEECNDKM